MDINESSFAMLPDTEYFGRSRTVKNLPEEDRPREKAVKSGIDSLSTSELFALILQTGTPGIPITTMCQNLLAAVDNRLFRLQQVSLSELMRIRGIGTAKAIQIQAAMELSRRYFVEAQMEGEQQVQITGPESIYNLMRTRMEYAENELIYVLLLRHNHTVIATKCVSEGGAKATVFDLKKILRLVLDTRGCEAVAMCHNHPSGSLTPSVPDDKITRSLVDGCRMIDTRVIDHVIISRNGYYSYADHGRL